METKTLLIVDDDPVIRTLISEIAESFGHKVEALASGEECLRRLSQHLPDILILDLQMPDMLGTDVLKKIREDTSMAKLPVIMLSANSDCSAQAAESSSKASLYLNKPFRVPEFLAALEKA